MPITPNFTRDDIQGRFDRFLEEVEAAQIELLKVLGEKCFIEARTNHAYIDQTGALSSSIGYTVFKNGVAVHEYFEAVEKQAKAEGKITREEAMRRGRELAAKIGAETKGLALVVVAGMNYALYVEAGHSGVAGRNVLASAEHLAQIELPRMLEELKKSMKEAI